MKKQKSVVRVGGGGEESRHPELAAVVAAEKMETGEAPPVCVAVMSAICLSPFRMPIAREQELRRV